MKTLVSPVPELSEFESELLESVRQALTGGFVGQTVEYSPTAIAAIKKRGRPQAVANEQRHCALMKVL